jgi:hypothetical protein
LICAARSPARTAIVDYEIAVPRHPSQKTGNSTIEIVNVLTVKQPIQTRGFTLLHALATR